MFPEISYAPKTPSPSNIKTLRALLSRAFLVLISDIKEYVIGQLGAAGVVFKAGNNVRDKPGVCMATFVLSRKVPGKTKPRATS